MNSLNPCLYCFLCKTTSLNTAIVSSNKAFLDSLTQQRDLDLRFYMEGVNRKGFHFE